MKRSLWMAAVEAFAALAMACGAFGAQPAVDNDGGAVNIANGVSALRGNLTAGLVADVYVCWGTADGGGANTAAWQNVTFVGSLSQGAAFSTNVAAYYGPKYYYR